MLLIRSVCSCSAARSLRELVQRAKPEGTSSTSLSKWALGPKEPLRPVRTAKDPAARAGWVGLIRTNKRVSGRGVVDLADGFCGLQTCVGGAAAVILAYEGEGCGLSVLELEAGEGPGGGDTEEGGTEEGDPGGVSWKRAGPGVVFVMEPV